jgi:hypothetical protein
MNREPSAWGYNWATLSLADMKMGSRVSNKTVKYAYESYEALTEGKLAVIHNVTLTMSLNLESRVEAG